MSRPLSRRSTVAVVVCVRACVRLTLPLSAFRSPGFRSNPEHDAVRNIGECSARTLQLLATLAARHRCYSYIPLPQVGLLLLVAVTVAVAAPAPAIDAENRVEGEYIAGNSYRVRYVADARGFHATVVFIGDIGQPQLAQGSDRVGAVVPVVPVAPTTVMPVAASTVVPVASSTVVPVASSTVVAGDDADDDDDDYQEEDDDENTFVRPPVVMSGKPSKLQDDDGIGCAIRNSLCGK